MIGRRDSGEGSVIAVVLAYDGTDFAGSQIQPDQDTVQGRLESALETILHRPARVTMAGRTDAGVHANGQVASFTANGDEPKPDALRRSLEALCGPGVSIRRVFVAASGFSARHSAIGREYRYRIALGSAKPVFLARHAWWVKYDLDVEAMRVAATHFVGEHDFAAFCVSESAREQHTVRLVEEIDLAQEEEMGEEVLTIRVKGRSFVHSQVRVMVGSLVEVGRGRRPPGWIGEVLTSGSRVEAGPTAPACGLTLWEVQYPEGLLDESV